MTPEQLKASILQRAMEGKLVPQDPNDEPASELLKRIKAEKEKLIKEGKIKRDKNETEIYRGDDGLHYEKFADGTVKEVEVPFEIPESWEWATLGKIGNWGSGATPAKSNPKYYTDGTIPWLLTGDLNDGFITNIDGKITELALEKTSVKLNPAGSVLIAMYGATIGRVGILTFASTTNQACCACNRLIEIDNRYLFYFLMSQRTAFAKKAEGGAQPNISKEKIVKTAFPIPPLNEQHRIVKQIDIALQKIEGYTDFYKNLEKLNKEFPEKLRKSILQYAMQGKLVPQDPNDEPVEVLLEKIRAEKQKLFEEGKLKKKDLEESIIYKGDDNSYYEKNGNSEVKLDDIPELPSTWEYARFKDIVSYYMGKTPPRSANEYWGDDIPWVSIADMPANGIITSPKEHVSHEAKKLFKDKISPAGTLLMSFKLTVGRVSLLGIEATHNEAIISIFPYVDTDESLKMYLFKFLPQIANGGDSKDAIKGTTLNSQSINNLLIPMPPLEEQSRIIQEVAKFEDLIPQLG